ncbi:aminotransferase class I/II-fold pyridoxal phosphate-dependent enzyme [bacterium]|nr:aminotransferase class I/II-fold pyridoxal phosphate-dependent enzyme [bacterium]
MSTLLEEIDFNKIEFLMFVLDELADKLSTEGKDVIKLTLGKAQEPLHNEIVNAHIEAIKDPEKRNLVYPEGLPLLREKIAEWYTSIGNPVDSKNVLVNTGTSPFFKDLFRLMIEEGDEILIPGPYYSVYYVCGLLARAKVKFYSVDPDTLRIDMESLKENYNPERTKFIVFCSPGNPYGNIVSAGEYKEVLNMISDKTYLLGDEIYRNTGFYDKVPSLLDVTEKRDNIIITNSFSKGFRMYTARVGFCILPDKLLQPIRVLLQHTLLTTNPTEQFAVVEALNHLSEVVELTETYRKRSEYIIKKLSDIKDVKVIKSQGGFYTVVDCTEFIKKHNLEGSFELAKDILNETGVAVVPGSDFGLPNGLRISFTHLRFNEGIDRLHKYFINKQVS